MPRRKLPLPPLLRRLRKLDFFPDKPVKSGQAGYDNDKLEEYTMAFTAADVKTLREMTGVGMLDCKKALAETDGDMDKAVAFLREKGLAAAQKKAGRVAAEGMAYAEVFADGAALVEVNAETDFVAQNEKFVEFVKDICYVVGK